jgi:hypothetical protein
MIGVKETFTKTSMVSAEGGYRAAEKMVPAAALISIDLFTLFLRGR